MAARKVSAPQLAAELSGFDVEVDEAKVRKWRSGSTMLPLHLAQPLARLLQLQDSQSDPDLVGRFGYDPMIMVRLFGLVPRSEDADRLLMRRRLWEQDADDRELVKRLLLLEQLELELAESTQLLAEFEHNQAAHIVLNAVEQSSDYGVAFWPVHVGPTSDARHQLHVSDRVDLRRLDGRPTSEEATWRDLGESLARARALPSLAEPRWTSVGDELPLADPHVSRWNLRRLDVPRAPRISRSHPGLPALAFSATVSSTWVGNLAAILALVLGYGVTSTTDLGRPLAGNASFKPDTAYRCRVHSELLREPGDRRVWFHASMLHQDYPGSPWQPSRGSAPPEIVHVRLYESDELLEATAEERSRHPDYDPKALAKWRMSRDLALETRPPGERTLVLNVEHSAWGSSAKWLQTFSRAREVLCFLKELDIQPWEGLGRSQQRWVEDDMGLTRPALTWLREAAAPFVYAPFEVCAEPLLEVPTSSRRIADERPSLI